MEYLLIYLAFGFFVGLIGRNRSMGFWGYFFFSILLTPIVGLVMLSVSAPREVRKPPPVRREAALADDASDAAARTLMERIDRLVASQRITRQYATRELVPLLVRDARGTARSGTDGPGGRTLDTILGALEALPTPAVAPVRSGPPPA